MSQENVELVRELWEPFKGVDNTAIDWDDEAIREMTERFWSPEIELRWTRSGPEARVYQGRDGVIQAFREWSEAFSEYYNEPLDFIEVGDRVVVPNRQWGIGSTSGIPVEDEFTSASMKSGIARSPGSMSTTHSKRPSKPSGCRSKTLTPTPEPAGYCAGDVAGERGDRARRLRGVERPAPVSRTSPTSIRNSSITLAQTSPTRARTSVAMRTSGSFSDSLNRFRSHVRGAGVDRRRRLRDHFDRAARGAAWQGSTSGAGVSDTYVFVYMLRDGLVVEGWEYGRDKRPSKPWACRSKTLTPTPEPAGYCAGDVAGERGDRPARHRGVECR